MKKILAILLATLMMFSAFGAVSFAADVPATDVTLNDILAKAAEWTDSTGTKPVVLVFNPGTAKMGQIYEGDLWAITAGPNRGCYALIGENFVEGTYVQLPNIKDAGDGMAANWMVTTAISDQGRTYGSGTSFLITPEVAEHDYVVFYAQLTPNETTPVIATIMSIFYKVINVLFGSDLANKFLEVLAGLGLEIEI